MYRDTTNTADIIDSRNIIERIEALESCDDLDQDETEELASLRKLAEQGERFEPAWQSGVALIRDDYFRHYIREQAEEYGDLTRGSMLANYIDWDWYARDVQTDWSAIDYDGVTYWLR